MEVTVVTPIPTVARGGVVVTLEAVATLGAAVLEAILEEAMGIRETTIRRPSSSNGLHQVLEMVSCIQVILDSPLPLVCIMLICLYSSIAVSSSQRSCQSQLHSSQRLKYYTK